MDMLRQAIDRKELMARPERLLGGTPRPFGAALRALERLRT